MIERNLDFIETASLRVDATQVINASPERVWAVLADHRRWPEWFGPSLVGCEPTSTVEDGVGATREVRLLGGTTIAERFIAWDHPEVWAFTGTACRPKVFAELVERAQLEGLGDGRTQITYTLAATPSRVLGWAMPVLRVAIARSLASSLRGLAKRSAE